MAVLHQQNPPMLDQVDIKAITAVTLSGTVVAFPRIQSADSQARRRSLADGSLNPQTLRVSHQPPSAKNPIQRSLLSLDKTYSRVDANGNVLSQDTLNVQLQFSKTANVSEAEYIAQLEKLIGALTETRSTIVYALARQLYNLEA